MVATAEGPPHVSCQCSLGGRGTSVQNCSSFLRIFGTPHCTWGESQVTKSLQTRATTQLSRIAGSAGVSPASRRGFRPPFGVANACSPYPFAPIPPSLRTDQNHAGPLRNLRHPVFSQSSIIWLSCG